MKSLFRIVRRYMGLAVLIGFLILFLNIMLYGKFITDYAQKYGKNYSYCSDLEMISRELSPEGGALGLGERAGIGGKVQDGTV